MKKVIWLCLFLPMISYSAGLASYALLFNIFYNESITEWQRFIPSTALIYFVVNSACFFLSFVLLNTIQKYSFWTQTLLFVISSIFSVYLVPFMSGMFVVKPDFIWTKEGLSFYVLFGTGSIVTSYGIWRSHTRRNLPA